MIELLNKWRAQWPPNAGLKLLAFLAMVLMLVSHDPAFAQQKGMMVRLSEIQIDPQHLEAYKAILKKEAEASVRLEPGVISIFPMYQKEHPTEVRILEIYASREAYELHIKTPHFKLYKTTTLKMVKSLKLVDMQAIDAESMPKIFEKLNSVKK